MGLGDSVAALLDTYANFLQLLKASSRRKDDKKAYADEMLLRRSLTSDHAQVKRAYSSRVSVAGSRFKKGDGPSRSSLRRVLRKLTAAIENILYKSNTQSSVLDYRSLASLSNASRIEAINVFDGLSHRLSSAPSRSSLASKSPRSSSGSASKRKHRRSSTSPSSSSKRSDSSSKGSSKHGPKRDSHRQRKETTSREQREGSGKMKMAPRSDRPAHPSRTNSAETAVGRRHPSSEHASGSSRTAVQHRMSYASVSTDSTKLGEIPERKWRRRYDTDSSSEYGITPVYPLKRYNPPQAKERRFFGLFKR